MKSGIDHVINREIKKAEDVANILYLPYDGWFEQTLDQSTKYYAMIDDAVYEWPCKNWPKYLNNLSKINLIPNRIDLDAIVINSRLQIEKASKIGKLFHLPVVLFEHDIPLEKHNTNVKKWINSRIPKNIIHVVPDNFVKDVWVLDEQEVKTINYGFKLNDVTNKENDVLVVGDYSSYDNRLIEHMMGSHPSSIALGCNNPQMTPYKDASEVYKAMLNSKVCITATQENRPPILAMMAAANGCVVVTNKTIWSEQVFTHEENALMFDSSSKIKRMVKDLLADETLISKLSSNARGTISRRFNYGDFQESWKNLIDEISKRIYLR